MDKIVCIIVIVAVVLLSAAFLRGEAYERKQPCSFFKDSKINQIPARCFAEFSIPTTYEK